MDTGGGERAWRQGPRTGEGRHRARVLAVETENRDYKRVTQGVDWTQAGDRRGSEGRGCKNHSEDSRIRNTAGFQLGS